MDHRYRSQSQVIKLSSHSDTVIHSFVYFLVQSEDIQLHFSNLLFDSGHTQLFFSNLNFHVEILQLLLLFRCHLNL